MFSKARITARRLAPLSFALTLCFVGASMVETSSAFVRLQTGGAGLFWPGATANPISFVVSQTQVPAGLGDAAFTAAARQSFLSWEQAPGVGVSFVEDGAPTSRSRRDHAASDSHLVMFDPDGSTGFFGSSGLVAVTPVAFLSDGTIVDADIIVNARDHSFSNDLSPGTFDLQSVLTHEVGHFIGLDHTGVLGCTMVPFTSVEEDRQRTLELDDIAAAATLYPDLSFQAAGIRGRVVDELGQGVAGAHVVSLLDDGRIAAAALSDNQGTFSLAGLVAQQSYRVYAEPLIGAISGDSFSNQLSGQTIDVDFGAAFHASNGLAIRVPAASPSADIGSFVVPPAAQPIALRMNSSSAPIVGRGRIVRMSLSTRGVLPGDQFLCSSPGVTISDVTVTGSGSSVTFRLQVPGSLAPGLYGLFVERPSTRELAALSGGLEVTGEGVALTGLAPSTVSSLGGEVVVVTGSGFESGVQVSVGGVDITAVNVISPTQLAFLSPALPAGFYDVRVQGPTGSSGVLPSALTLVEVAQPQPQPQPQPQAQPQPQPQAQPTQSSVTSASSGGGGGGGGCSVAPGASERPFEPAELWPLLLILLLSMARRRR
jgi:MYXO-CTERM domain-containing protein